jgi:hypothetical protein
VQVDHALADVIVVDERDREAIGRPSLTMAIDVFTRIVLGFYELGVPYSSYWRVDALERFALASLALARTQVLIIEEVQQMLAGSAREQRSSFNLIKSITNDLQISIVAVGTGEARHAIEADPQIRRHFDAFFLPRWTECKDFRDFICAFGKLYPLRKPSKLGERGIIQKVLNASEGITGPVTRVLALAAIEAIRSSGEFINEAGIEAAAARMRQTCHETGRARPASLYCRAAQAMAIAARAESGHLCRS